MPRTSARSFGDLVAPALGARARFSAAVLVLALTGCGGSVYLGGTNDGGGDAGGTTPDAAPPFDRCDASVGPDIDAGCRACQKSEPTCQPNGCYGGFWCNTIQRDCHAPPDHCP